VSHLIERQANHLYFFPQQIMVTNVTSLLKTVKAVEDEHTRGTRALESSIEAIAQEIRAFDSSDQPKGKAEPEDLIRATRPITLATGKAVSAGKSCKQEDVIVAANMGRKAISDMLITCKAVAYDSKKREASQRATQAGREVAQQYRELLQMVMHQLSRPSSDARSSMGNVSRKIAQFVTELATAAELLKDSDDWVDPSDPTFIAENELLGAAKSIENAAKKLASLKPRREIKGKVRKTLINVFRLAPVPHTHVSRERVVALLPLAEDHVSRAPTTAARLLTTLSFPGDMFDILGCYPRERQPEFRHITWR